MVHRKLKRKNRNSKKLVNYKMHELETGAFEPEQDPEVGQKKKVCHVVQPIGAAA